MNAITHARVSTLDRADRRTSLDAQLAARRLRAGE